MALELRWQRRSMDVSGNDSSMDVHILWLAIR